jgi:hypothetical protein
MSRSDTRIDPEQDVYIAEHSDGFLKVGVSRDPWTRVEELDVGPHPLELRYVYPTDHAYRVEQTIHHYWSEHNVRGEWFDVTDRQLAELLALLPEIDRISSTGESTRRLDTIRGTAPAELWTELKENVLARDVVALPPNPGYCDFSTEVEGFVEKGIGWFKDNKREFVGDTFRVSAGKSVDVGGETIHLSEGEPIGFADNMDNIEALTTYAMNDWGPKETTHRLTKQPHLTQKIFASVMKQAFRELDRVVVVNDHMNFRMKYNVSD